MAISLERIPIRLTREGWSFCFINLLVGGAAINTGNNLLYLVFGMMLGLIIASGVLSNMALQGLAIRRSVPSRIFAGVSFLMGIGVTNRKRKLPSFSIEVEDLLDQRPVRKRCFFLKVPAGRSQQTSYRQQFARRGLYRLTGFRASTKFPFALFRKWREVRAPSEVVVFPALGRLSPRELGDATRSGDENASRRGRRGEFAGLRPAEAWDDARDIHWRASARSGRLLARENEDEQQRAIFIILDNAPGPDSPGDSRNDPALEEAVSRAAALIVHYVARGFAVGLALRGSLFPLGVGETQVSRLLRELALLGWAPPGVEMPTIPHFARATVVERSADQRAIA